MSHIDLNEKLESFRDSHPAIDVQALLRDVHHMVDRLIMDVDVVLRCDRRTAAKYCRSPYRYVRRIICDRFGIRGA